MYTQQHEQKTGMIYRLPQVDEKRKNRPLKCNMWEIINKQAKSRPTKRTKGNKTFFTQSDPIYKSDPIRFVKSPRRRKEFRPEPRLLIEASLDNDVVYVQQQIREAAGEVV
jgi:hypothetical protein